jgi:hypothetical protein
MTKTIIAATGIMLALLAGCSSTASTSAGGGAAGGGKDPCSLLTDDQLTKAFGQPPSSRAPSTAGINGCKWLFANDNASLNVYLAAAGEVEPRIAGNDSVPDVGDKAGWSPDTGVMFAVAGDKGLHVILGIGITGVGSPEHKAREKAAGISVTRNAFAALGLGKADDSTVPGAEAKKTTAPPATTETSERADPSETTEPSEPAEPSDPAEPEQTTETPEN